MIFHVKIDTHKFNWIDLYLQNIPSKDDLLKIVDSIIKQYENGKPLAKNQYGYDWDWRRGIDQWKRAWKIINATNKHDYIVVIDDLTESIRNHTTALVYTASLVSNYSNKYTIQFSAIDPLVDVNDPRLSHTIQRMK